MNHDVESARLDLAEEIKRENQPNLLIDEQIRKLRHAFAQDPLVVDYQKTQKEAVFLEEQISGIKLKIEGALTRLERVKSTIDDNNDSTHTS